MLSPSLLRRLDLRTLQLFTVICEEGNLTRAAHREAIAPSAVSKRLVELETSLGVQLLDRGPKGMTTTAAGQTLLHHARRMLFNLEQMSLELTDFARGVRGHVRVLANLSAIVQFLPEDLRSFLERQDAIRLDLEERPSSSVVRGIEEGAAEIGICADNVPTHALRSQLYRSDELVLVMRHDHPLAGCEALAFEDCLDHDFVGLHAESSIYQTVRGEAQRSGRPLRLRVHVPGFDAVCRMAQADIGLGVLPQRAFDLLGQPMGLVAVPLRDPWAQRELRLVVRDGPLAPAAQLLLDHLTAGAA
ncbi:LysR family transcriptional regulator [Methylobacterium brachythecii]|uniref:DNA-binding transcriptional LysR family regulator n=1 Tax=Methylobacterium brachythecii TaxID=1176177 RepID=A0A7W6AS82_9HYPH|nr:LysR family transcriptional regulator [Methylobacterium brachythecii]MBB3905656.1 DNA-binding transcriptional LysR family regulator [Methylobacterium brachythecii]GLS46912.1 LysR family transcriptional regulator [Methylobacterium brachythecii]